MRFWAWGIAAAAMLAAGLPQEADAQDRQTRQRLQRLEQQLQDLQGVVYGADGEGAPVRFAGADPNGQQAQGSAASGNAAASALAVRVGQLEQEVQRLTGEIERLSFQLNQQRQQMERLISTAYPEYEGEQGLGLQAQRDRVSAGGQPVTGGGPIDLDSGGTASDSLPDFASAESAYAAGRSALLEARYADAERAFLALIDEYPDSSRVGDARFYLGETYLAQGDLGASARTFLDFIRNHSDNDRAAEAHLKLGQAFARADKTTEACRVWARGLQAYPNMQQSVKSRMGDLRGATCS